jgi:hypothetical protein
MQALLGDRQGGTEPTLTDDNPFVGIWTLDEGYQVTELLLRSDGRYQIETRSTNPDLDYVLGEPGGYAIDTQNRLLTLTPFEHFGDPEHKQFTFELNGESLTLVRVDVELSYVYQFKAGSRADVLAREQVGRDPVGSWIRKIPYSGTEAYTFRPDGHFAKVNTPEDSQFPPDIMRGRYAQDDMRLTLNPYAGVQAAFDLDFFGSTLTLITVDPFSAQVYTYEMVVGSGAEVRAKTDEAHSFLDRENWQVGIWEIRSGVQNVDLTIRPDGHYISQEFTESLPGIVRGRYTLETSRIKLAPFVGQGIYARSNGEFGLVERTRELDYYDGELYFIDLETLSDPVTVARLRADSDRAVLESAAAVQAQRATEGWYLGIWQVHDPVGWMELTLRPDQRYIAKAGQDGVAAQVERGTYALTSEKLTLAPYAGLGPARGFEVDLYAGDLFLAGDLYRLVVARKVVDSASEVAEKTNAPSSLLGELGSILGRWSADRPGESAELVFRPDGQFRLKRCSGGVMSHDYGLYSVDMNARTLVSDSRFTPVQTLGLDFYGETLTIFGGSLGPPSTYVVNLGTAAAAIAASLAADAEAATVDAAWLARVPIEPLDPGAVQVGTGDIPADPQPQHVFQAATVVKQVALYRRLLPGFVYFSDMGVIRSVAVVNTREFWFFPTGRVLVRFTNHHAGPAYPFTTTEVSDTWGAYRVGEKPAQQDILHLYADHSVWVETDAGEQIELTLENGRRNLFWAKDYQLFSEWAAEQQTETCQGSGQPDPSLMNTGLGLTTQIPPDQTL